MSWLKYAAPLIAATVIAPNGLQAQSAAAGSSPAHADNYYAAGNRIAITTPMGADVIVAGREIDIDRPVAGDILAAGWRVTLSDQANDDVRMVGSEVTVNASVAGDLTLAGGQVTVGPLSRVNGRTWLTGGTVRIDGILERDVRIAAATVVIGGEIRQPLEVTADTLEILPSARILAPLAYKGSREPRIAQGAVVNGPITYDWISRAEAQRARAVPAVSSVLFALHLLLVGLLAVYFLPRVETSVVATLRARPGRSLLAGALLLVGMPAAAVLLVASVLGLPLGLALGSLYLLALFGGVLATALFVGDAEARLLRTGPMVTRGQHALLLVAGVLTLALLRSLVGGLVVLVSVLFGLGALALAAYDAYGKASHATPA